MNFIAFIDLHKKRMSCEFNGHMNFLHYGHMHYVEWSWRLGAGKEKEKEKKAHIKAYSGLEKKHFCEGLKREKNPCPNIKKKGAQGKEVTRRQFRCWRERVSNAFFFSVSSFLPPLHFIPFQSPSSARCFVPSSDVLSLLLSRRCSPLHSSYHLSLLSLSLSLSLVS